MQMSMEEMLIVITGIPKEMIEKMSAHEIEDLYNERIVNR